VFLSRIPVPRKIAGLPRPAWILFGGTFINRFGNFLPVFLVLYLTAKGYSSAIAGAALGVVGAGNLVGNAIGGSIADRFGRRGTIVLSMIGSGLSTILVRFVGNIVLLFILVGVVGLFSQIYQPASGAILLDVVPDDRRTIAFAVYRLAVNLGMAAGPVVGGVISNHSYTWLFIGDAFSSFAYCGIALLMLPETGPGAVTGGETPGQQVRRREGYLSVIRGNRHFLFFLCGIMAAAYIYIQSTATLPLQVRDSGLPNSFYGLLLGMNAAVAVVCELPITHLVEKLPSAIVITSGLGLMGVGFGLTAFAHSPESLVVTVLTWTVGEMIMMPLAFAHPGRTAPPQLRGRYQGSFGLAQSVSTGVGPVIGGYLYSRNHALNWGVCGLVGIIGMAFMIAGTRTRTRAHRPVSYPVPEARPESPAASRKEGGSADS
jgi:MFS family permease